MNKIKDALWNFIGHDGVIEYDYDGTVISGTNETMFIIIRSPKSTLNNKWVVTIYPRACVDAGRDSGCVSTEENTDFDVCNWFSDNKWFIHTTILEILTKCYKEIHSTLEDIEEFGKDLDLCD